MLEQWNKEQIKHTPWQTNLQKWLFVLHMQLSASHVKNMYHKLLIVHLTLCGPVFQYSTKTQKHKCILFFCTVFLNKIAEPLLAKTLQLLHVLALVHRQAELLEQLHEFWSQAQVQQYDGCTGYSQERSRHPQNGQWLKRALTWNSGSCGMFSSWVGHVAVRGVAALFFNVFILQIKGMFFFWAPEPLLDQTETHSAQLRHWGGSGVSISPTGCPNSQISDTDTTPGFQQEPMTSDQMVSASLIWQLWHVGKGLDVFAEPPNWVHTCSSVHFDPDVSMLTLVSDPVYWNPLWQGLMSHCAVLNDMRMVVDGWMQQCILVTHSLGAQSQQENMQSPHLLPCVCVCVCLSVRLSVCLCTHWCVWTEEGTYGGIEAFQYVLSLNGWSPNQVYGHSTRSSCTDISCA